MPKKVKAKLVAVRMACSWAGVEGDEEADVPAWARDDGDSGRGLCGRKHESGMTEELH